MLRTLALLAFVAAQATKPSAPSAASSAAAEPVAFEVLEYRDRIEKDGSRVRTTAVTVRLGTAQGVAQFGQIGDSYVEGFGSVAIEAVVIEKPDGRRVEVKNGTVEDVSPFGMTGSSAPADVRIKRMTIPGLEPGDRLSYRLLSQQKAMMPGRVAGHMKLPLMLQDVVQTYELDIPRDAGISVRLREGLGTGWEEVASTPDRLVRRLRMAVKRPDPEKPMGKDERESWLEADVMYTSFTSWNDVASWWWALSKDRLKPDAEVSKLAAELTRGLGTPREKLSALQAFVGGRIRYLNVGFGVGRLQPHAAAEVLQTRYGDCKDKHVLLAALATSVGIDVRPVLVHTDLSRLRDEAPGPQQFNHMISVVRLGSSPAEWLWLDSTNPFASPGHTMPYLRDKRVLVVEADGGATLVTTPAEPPFVQRHAATFNARIDAEGVLRGRATWLMRSDEEVQMRGALSVLPRERLPELTQATVKQIWKDAKATNPAISDPLDVREPFRLEFDLETSLPAKNGERRLPISIVDFELPQPLDPVPAGDPAVAFRIGETTARSEITLAEGERGRAPLSVSLERPFGTYRSIYSVEGSTLKMERVLTFRQRELRDADAVAAYVSFRKAVKKDLDQEFTIEGVKQGLPSAEGQRKDGLAAFEKEDYVKAAELLQKAADADPKLGNVWMDLGKALYELDRDKDAVAAFTRQIEASPFHENSYAWRAHSLTRMNRWEEAEKDLLKQIEVAPFESWSYEKLGDRRFSQQKYAEAADYYARAAAIESTEAKRWINLADAQQRASRPAEARASLEKALALEIKDWMKVNIATIYRRLGDLSKAGELAQAAAPSLARRLAKLTPDHFGDGDVWWTEKIAEAWGIVGEAALKAGDVATAERYLDAAWRLAFSPEAGWALGEVREKQGRLADAVELWARAAFVPTASFSLPADHKARIEAACRKLPPPPAAALPAGLPKALVAALPKPSCPETTDSGLMDLRGIRFHPAAPTGISAQVLLLAGPDGRVETMRPASKSDSNGLEKVLAGVGPVRVPALQPDGEAFKSVRRALLACSTNSGCLLMLQMPGAEFGPTVADVGSLRLVSVEPKDGTELVVGQSVSVQATVHYDMKPGQSRVTLAILDQTGRGLPDSPPEQTVGDASGEVTFRSTISVPATATKICVVAFLPVTGQGSRAEQGPCYKIRQR